MNEEVYVGSFHASTCHHVSPTTTKRGLQISQATVSPACLATASQRPTHRGLREARHLLRGGAFRWEKDSVNSTVPRFNFHSRAAVLLLTLPSLETTVPLRITFFSSKGKWQDLAGMECFKRTLLIWFGFPVCLGFEMWSSILHCHPEKSKINCFFYSMMHLVCWQHWVTAIYIR